MQKKTELIVICSVIVLGVIFATHYSFENQTATISNNIIPTTASPSSDPDEQKFDTPVSITWKAKILGCLVSCAGYSFQNLDPRAKYTYFQGYDDLLDERYLDLRDRTVQIKGQWTGIDCAYKNTVFDGNCTPSVEIIELTEFPENIVDWFSEKRVTVDGMNYMATEWRTAGNASENVEFSLWELKTGSKSYSYWADYNFRKDSPDEELCGRPKYSEGSLIGDVGTFFRNKILQFQKIEKWPKQCLKI